MRSMHAFRLSGSRERWKNKEELGKLKKGPQEPEKVGDIKKKNGGFGFGKMTMNESFSLSQEDRKMLM